MADISSKDKECSFVKKHKISEWKEKSLVLSLEEQKKVLLLLKEEDIHGEVLDSKERELLDIVRLPFPKFITKYYITYYSEALTLNRVPILDELLNLKSMSEDPTIGYKLYLMPEKFLKCIDYYFKDTKNIYSNIQGTRRFYGELSYVRKFLTSDIEDIPRLRTNVKTNYDIISKYLNIMQYVDAKEAERLGLKGFAFKTDEGYRGFDLEGKLDLLNPLARYVIETFIGLHSGFRTELSKIALKLNIGEKKLYEVFSQEFFNVMFKSTGMFKNYLSTIDIPHSNRVQYRHNSIIGNKLQKFEILFILNNFNKLGIADEDRPKTITNSAIIYYGNYVDQIGSMIEMLNCPIIEEEKSFENI